VVPLPVVTDPVVKGSCPVVGIPVVMALEGTCAEEAGRPVVATPVVGIPVVALPVVGTPVVGIPVVGIPVVTQRALEHDCALRHAEMSVL